VADLLALERLMLLVQPRSERREIVRELLDQPVDPVLLRPERPRAPFQLLHLRQRTHPG
jgi:hypothetical protein